MQNLYKITTVKSFFFFETENMVIVSVYNKQLNEYIGKSLMEIIRYCEIKNYSIEKTPKQSHVEFFEQLK